MNELNKERLVDKVLNGYSGTNTTTTISPHDLANVSGSTSTSAWIGNTIIATTSYPYVNDLFYSDASPLVSALNEEQQEKIYSEIEKLGLTKLNSGSLVNMRILEIVSHDSRNLRGYKLFFKANQDKWLSEFILGLNIYTSEYQICVSDDFLDIYRDDLVEEIKKVMLEHDRVEFRSGYINVGY